ncbi:hypothetical protein B0H10DRAFT_1942277 [Mycena sp. CBHHK59/15]|nr:hypothetical protein B0H10DRAFT_1942277 [Mycena sp. CBHHK59/15]
MAIDFLKDVRLGLRDRGATDAEKLEEVGDRFRHGSPADIWFRGKTFKTWTAFTKVFEERFAGMVPIAKPRPQLLAELTGMRIAVGHLAAEHILVGGERIAPMVEFRARLREAVLDANAGTETEGVWGFHAALPAAVRVSIGNAPADWDAMLAALALVPQTAIDMVVEEHKRSCAFDKSMAELNQVMHSVRVSAAQQQQQAPRATTVVAATPPAGGPLVVVVNQGAAGGGGGRGAAGKREPIPQGTNEQRDRLRKIMLDTNATQALSNPAGHTQYGAQIAEWNKANGHIAPEAISIWSTGYPLSPGSARRPSFPFSSASTARIAGLGSAAFRRPRSR